MRQWRHANMTSTILRFCYCGMLLFTGAFLHAAAYTALVGGTNNVIIPNDGDSPYALSAIAVDIANSAIFAWHADSNTAVCAANMCISGTVHIGKVNAAGNYDAAGNEEKLFMTTNGVFQISITNGGVLIARGAQGTYGVRRVSTDVLANEISVIPRIYPKQFRLNVCSNGAIILHDTKVSWCAGAGGLPGFNIIGGEFDIQRCQLYTYQSYSPALTIDTRYVYANPILRDCYFGGGTNWSTVVFNRPGIKLGAGAGSNPTNFQIVNCEFDANDNISVASWSGNILDWYASGVEVVDCVFSRGCPAELLSVGAYAAQMEFRNCGFKAGTVRAPFFEGVGHVDTWAKHTHYLSCHVVNANATNMNVDTGNNDMIVEEQTMPTNLAAIYRFTGGSWSVATNFVTTGTDAIGWTPDPGTEGAIMVTEMTYTRVGSATLTNYYRYNLRIPTDRSFNYYSYDYHAQYGGRYITSIEVGGATNDACLGPGWYRPDASVPNPEPFLNDPPTNGTWYIGMDPKPRGTVFSFH